MTSVMIDGAPTKITHWLIRGDVPFSGYSQSFLLPDGTVAYTGGMTPEEYAADRGYPVCVITDEMFDGYLEIFRRSQISEPIEQTEEQFWDALEVLPPCRWHNHRCVELFHVSELLTMDLASWHARIGDRYFTFTDSAAASSDHLAAKVAAAAEGAA